MIGVRSARRARPWLGLALQAFEPAVLCVAAPLLLFPGWRPALTALALAAVLLAWLMRWLVAHQPWPVTPLNGALLVLALSVPLAVWASAWPELTLPKLTGLILGLAVYRATALAVGTRRALGWGLAAFGLLGLAILGVGMLGAGWPNKVAGLQPLLRRVPQLVAGLPGSSDNGINPNQLAGALALYAAPCLAFGLGWLRAGRKAAAAGWLLGAALTLVALFATQSRGGWIGGAAGLLALAWLALWRAGGRSRRTVALALVGCAVVALLGGILYVGPERLAAAFDPYAGGEAQMATAEEEMSLASRAEIWSRALYALQDFPFTGTGLGAFRRVVPLLYPLFLVSPDIDIAHAHNVFLQVALDLGLGGLVAYLALLGLAAGMCWLIAGSRDPLVSAAALGLLAGLVGLHVYGLADALALGSKPGVAFWAALGLIAGLWRIALAEQATAGQPDGPR